MCFSNDDQQIFVKHLVEFSTILPGQRDTPLVIFMIFGLRMLLYSLGIHHDMHVVSSVVSPQGGGFPSYPKERILLALKR